MMNATSKYVSTCRLILQAKIDESSTSSLMDLYKLFPQLRQALSCSVCSNLLIEPYTPSDSTCQHHVCRQCKGGKKKLKPSCSWCRDYTKYVENVQLRTLLQCYKKLCEYVTNSDIFRIISNLPSSSNSYPMDNKVLLDIIREGAGFKDDFKFNPGDYANAFNALNSSVATQTGENETSDSSNPRSPSQPVFYNGIACTYSVSYAGVGNRLTLKRNVENDPSESNDKASKIRKRSSFEGLVSTCNCGHSTNQNRLICRGYRCPCYSIDRPCINCVCRGCNNPLGVNPKDLSEIGEPSEQIGIRSKSSPYRQSLPTVPESPTKEPPT